MDLEKLLIFFF